MDLRKLNKTVDLLLKRLSRVVYSESYRDHKGKTVKFQVLTDGKQFFVAVDGVQGQHGPFAYIFKAKSAARDMIDDIAGF